VVVNFQTLDKSIFMKSKSGFSLVELLVVVAIIGILAAIGTVGYNKYINYAKDAVTRSNLNELANALKVEDNKLNICSNFPADNPYANTTGNGYYCVNEIAKSSGLKNPEGIPMSDGIDPVNNPTYLGPNWIDQASNDTSEEYTTYDSAGNPVIRKRQGNVFFVSCMNDAFEWTGSTKFASLSVSETQKPQPFGLIAFFSDGHHEIVTLDLKNKIQAACRY
jgi:type IV pilus assembly protein PilA